MAQDLAVNSHHWQNVFRLHEQRLAQLDRDIESFRAYLTVCHDQRLHDLQTSEACRAIVGNVSSLTRQIESLACRPVERVARSYQATTPETQAPEIGGHQSRSAESTNTEINTASSIEGTPLHSPVNPKRLRGPIDSFHAVVKKRQKIGQERWQTPGAMVTDDGLDISIQVEEMLSERKHRLLKLSPEMRQLYLDQKDRQGHGSKEHSSRKRNHEHEDLDAPDANLRGNLGAFHEPAFKRSKREQNPSRHV